MTTRSLPAVAVLHVRVVACTDPYPADGDWLKMMKAPRRANVRCRDQHHGRVLMSPERICSVDGCSKRVNARGWCAMHYVRWKKFGDVNRAPLTKVERFWRLIVFAPGGCWLWVGAVDHLGYGGFGSGLKAHRYSYELLVGPIPEGLELDHLCRNRACVRPDHLEPVTHRENIRRGVGWGAINARKTHCAKGHPYAGDNLRFEKDGARVCKACHRLANAEWRRRRRENSA